MVVKNMNAFLQRLEIILDSGPVECPVQFQRYLVTQFNSIGVWMNS